MTAAITTESTLSPISIAMPLEESVNTSNETPTLLVRLWDKIRTAIQEHIDDEEGMSTIEYALGCVAAAALGALLYTVVTSGAVENALSGIFERALNEGN